MIILQPENFANLRTSSFDDGCRFWAVHLWQYALDMPPLEILGHLKLILIWCKWPCIDIVLVLMSSAINSCMVAALELLLTGLRPPADTIMTILIYIQNPWKRHVSLYFSISKPYIQSNETLLGGHWLGISAAGVNTRHMPGSVKNSFKVIIC